MFSIFWLKVSVSLGPLPPPQQESLWIYGEWHGPLDPGRAHRPVRVGSFPSSLMFPSWWAASPLVTPGVKRGCSVASVVKPRAGVSRSFSSDSISAWWSCLADMPSRMLLALPMLLRSGCAFHRFPIQPPYLCSKSSLSLCPTWLFLILTL